MFLTEIGRPSLFRGIRPNLYYIRIWKRERRSAESDYVSPPPLPYMYVIRGRWLLSSLSQLNFSGKLPPGKWSVVSPDATWDGAESCQEVCSSVCCKARDFTWLVTVSLKSAKICVSSFSNQFPLTTRKQVMRSLFFKLGHVRYEEDKQNRGCLGGCVLFCNKRHSAGGGNGGDDERGGEEKRRSRDCYYNQAQQYEWRHAEGRGQALRKGGVLL